MNRARRRALAGLGLLALAPAARSQPPSPTTLLWLGQSAFRITTPGGKVILTDPYLSANPKTPPRYRTPEGLGAVDLILVTHAHADHLGDAVALARHYNVPIICPAGLASTLAALDLLPPELVPRMNKGGTVEPLGPGIRISMVHAEHSSELVWKNPASGQMEVHVGGEPVGFVLELEDGLRIYDMGDTALFSDLRLIGERFHPDVVLVPIGGHYTLDPVDAAYAVREWLKPATAIPMHYGTTAQLKGTPAEFRAALGASATRVLVLEPGQSVELAR